MAARTAVYALLSCVALVNAHSYMITPVPRYAVAGTPAASTTPVCGDPSGGAYTVSTPITAGEPVNTTWLTGHTDGSIDFNVLHMNETFFKKIKTIPFTATQPYPIVMPFDVPAGQWLLQFFWTRADTSKYYSCAKMDVTADPVGFFRLIDGATASDTANNTVTQYWQYSLADTSNFPWITASNLVKTNNLEVKLGNGIDSSFTSYASVDLTGKDASGMGFCNSQGQFDFVVAVDTTSNTAPYTLAGNSYNPNVNFATGHVQSDAHPDSPKYYQTTSYSLPQTSNGNNRIVLHSTGKFDDADLDFKLADDCGFTLNVIHSIHPNKTSSCINLPSSATKKTRYIMVPNMPSGYYLAAENGMCSFASVVGMSSTLLAVLLAFAMM